MQVAVAQVAEGDEPHARASAASSAASRPRRGTPGIAETGSEMSCLMLGPSRRCASAMFSRSAHSAAACSPDWASAASRATPLSSAAASAASTTRRERRVGRAVVGLDQHVPRVAGQRIGQRRDGACATARARGADISSKPVSRSPSACLQAAEQGDRGGDVGDGDQRGDLRAAARERASAPPR